MEESENFMAFYDHAKVTEELKYKATDIEKRFHELSKLFGFNERLKCKECSHREGKSVFHYV